MMKSRFALFLLAVFGFASVAALRGPAQQDPLSETGESRLVTLYAHDDLLSSFDFRAGAPGGRLFDGEVELSGAHVAFDVFEKDMISFGFLRDVPVRILDLGEFFVPPYVRAKDRSPKLSASLFHTLFRDGNRFEYLGSDGQVHVCRQASEILSPLPSASTFHLTPQVGHTYLVRIGGRRGSAEEFAKFEVVDFQPGHSLTIRWALVPRS